MLKGRGGGVRAFLVESVNFCTVWRMNNNFYLYLPTFSDTLSNRLFILFKYYFFISSFIIFLTTTHLLTFFYSTPNYYNRKKGFEEWTVTHQTWWATVHEQKKFQGIESPLETRFLVSLYYRENFAFSYTIGDALILDHSSNIYFLIWFLKSYIVLNYINLNWMSLHSTSVRNKIK